MCGARTTLVRVLRVLRPGPAESGPLAESRTRTTGSLSLRPKSGAGPGAGPDSRPRQIGNRGWPRFPAKPGPKPGPGIGESAECALKCNNEH
jgi:hypothetical protein